MAMTFEARLQTIGPAALTPPVRRVLGSENLEIIDWHYRILHGGVDSARTEVSGVVLFTGTGRVEGKAVPWSLVLKALPPSPSSDDPYEGTRELHAYRSRLLDKLPGDVAVPRCFGIVEEPDEAPLLWIEAVADEGGQRWPLSCYGLAARHFGQLNGAYLTRVTLPSEPWLSTRRLRSMMARRSADVALLPTVLEHPLISRVYPGDIAQGVLRLWAERERFLDALERMPQTFGHLDAARRNLFARTGPDGRAQTVAIDWASLGIAAVGQEMAALVWESLLSREVETAQLPELEEMVFNGYLDGLRSVGWRGDPRAVRFGYTAAAALLCGLPQYLRAFLVESLHPKVEQIFGCPIEELAVSLGNNLRLLLERAAEARALADSV